MGGRGASVKSIIAKYENHKKKIHNSSSAITRAERKNLSKLVILNERRKNQLLKTRVKTLLTEQKKLKTLAIMIIEKKTLLEGLSLLLQCSRKMEV